ncbi:hypothetical protein [Vibrio phage phiKT1028]|nr:hypothetical protein [Vibrio phage phiKT1028]
MSKYKHNSLIAAMGFQVAGMENLPAETDTLEMNPVVLPTEEDQERAAAEAEIKKVSDELTAALQADAEHQQTVAEATEAISGLESMFQGDFDEAVYRKHVGTLQAISERTEVPLAVTVDGMESLSSAQIYLDTMNGLEGFVDNLKSAGKTIKQFIIQIYKYLKELFTSFVDHFKSIEKQLVETQRLLNNVDEIKGQITLNKKWNQALNIGEIPMIKVRDMSVLIEMAEDIGDVNIGQIVDKSTPLSSKAIKFFKERITQQPGVKLVGTATDKGPSSTSVKTEVYELIIGNVELGYFVPASLVEGIESVKAFEALEAIRPEVTGGVRESAYTGKREITQELHDLIGCASAAKAVFEKLKRDIDKERDALIARINDHDTFSDRNGVAAGVKAKRKYLETNENTLFKLLQAKNHCIRAHL